MIIEKKYCGPSTSGQGGYVCGLIGRLIQGPAEVILRIPPPLEHELEVRMVGDYQVNIIDGDSVVAEAHPVTFEMDVPAPPTYAEAQTASKDYIGFKHHPFPCCFVCGPQRAIGDGMRIFPGPVAGGRMVAAPWISDSSMSDDHGLVKPEFIWAALDCPGAFAAMIDKPRIVVLGKLAVAVLKDIRANEQCVVIGWKIAEDGRKYYAGTAVFSESDGLCAKAKATWIELK
jgi:hypothetical protein